MTDIIKRPQYIIEASIPPHWLPAQDLPSILEYRKNLVGLEIGSCFGTSSHFLMETLPGLILHAVDPYVEYDQMTRRNEAYIAFHRLMEDYPGRLILHRKTSDDAIYDFDDESLDFIFIDGLHTYDQVKKDIQNYYPKLKIGGFIFGHDYAAWGTATGQNTIDLAVNEMASLYGRPVSFCEQDVWYWRK